MVVTDLNGDDRVDIISSNKRGVAIHFQHRHKGGDSGLGVWNAGAKDESAFAQSRTPEDAAKAMQIPDGFSVDLIASEPDLSQPIAMCFDARGRIWVAEGQTYPQRAPEGQGRDRILILEDTDRDGSFETKKVFVDGLNLVSGIEIGFGGVWVGAAPYFMFIPDKNSDDVPDSEPQILLDGWGYHDTHETLNSFTWGPDGWLYGCHGVFTHSRVGKPAAPDDQREPLNAAIWRYHPSRHNFEIFAWGGSNQWGIDYNDHGDWFMECCVIPHLFHVIQARGIIGKLANTSIRMSTKTCQRLPTICTMAMARSRRCRRVDESTVTWFAATPLRRRWSVEATRTAAWRSIWEIHFPSRITVTCSSTIFMVIGSYENLWSPTDRATSVIIAPTWCGRSIMRSSAWV